MGPSKRANQQGSRMHNSSHPKIPFACPSFGRVLTIALQLVVAVVSYLWGTRVNLNAFFVTQSNSDILCSYSCPRLLSKGGPLHPLMIIESRTVSSGVTMGSKALDYLQVFSLTTNQSSVQFVTAQLIISFY